MLRLRRRELACREAVELVTDYLEGALSARERRRFERHLAACPNCRRYIEQIRLTIAIAGTFESDELGHDARAELVALYRRWRDEP